MANLVTTTQTLRIVLGEAKTTNDCDICAFWGDTTVPFTLGAQDEVSNGVTPVTVVAAPAANVQRQVKEVRLHNNDTVNHSVTLQFDDNGTIRILDGPVTIAPNGNYLYTPALTTGPLSVPTQSWVEISTTTVSGASSSGTIALPAGFRRYRVTLQNVTVSAAGGQLQMQLSVNGGSTFIAAGYAWQGITMLSSTVTGVSSTLTNVALMTGMATSGLGDAVYEIYPGSNGSFAMVRGTHHEFDNNGGSAVWANGLYSAAVSVTGVVNAIQINVSSGVWSGLAILEGLP